MTVLYLLPTGAAAPVRWCGDIHLLQGGQGHERHGEHPFSLGRTHIGLHNIGRAIEYLYAQRSRGLEAAFHARNQRPAPLGGGLAPVPIPPIYANGRRWLRIDPGWLRIYVTGLRVPVLQGQLDHLGVAGARDK